MSTEDIEVMYISGKDNVSVVDTFVAKSSLTDVEKDRLSQSVRHLEGIKKYKNGDGSSVWTSEDFTDINNAITAGNAKLG